MHRETRSFATITRELLNLAEWHGAHDGTHVAIEATGVYWQPVQHMREDDFALVMANAQLVRNVP
jgi:transposase